MTWDLCLAIDYFRWLTKVIATIVIRLPPMGYIVFLKSLQSVAWEYYCVEYWLQVRQSHSAHDQANWSPMHLCNTVKHTGNKLQLIINHVLLRDKIQPTDQLIVHDFKRPGSDTEQRQLTLCNVLINKRLQRLWLLFIWYRRSRRTVHKLRSPPMFQGVGAGYWV